MKKLEFEVAFQRFKRTVPGVIDFTHERLAAGPDREELDGTCLDVVRYYQPRLNTHLRTIGGWTFLAENLFLSEHVGRIFFVWWWFGGGMTTGNEPLMRALQHCFKRFYAESALAECNTVTARALLIEATVFERELLKPLEQQIKNDEKIQELNDAFGRCAQFIGRYHEIGHFSLQATGKDIIELGAGLFDGIAITKITGLVESGRHELAEEVFCDLLALQSAIALSDSPLIGLEMALRIKLAMFCHACVSYLSHVNFSARVDARREFMGKASAPFLRDEFSDFSDAIIERVFVIDDVLKEYAKQQGLKLFGRHGDFDLITFPSAQFLEIFVSYLDTSKSMVFGSTLCDNEYRNIAKFLALAISSDADVAQYLLTCSKDLSVFGQS
jgi:hypothetical protein